MDPAVSQSRVVPLKWKLLATALTVALAALTVRLESIAHRDKARKIAELEAENRQLQARYQQLAGESEDLRRQLQMTVAGAAGAETAAQRRPGAVSAAAKAEESRLLELREKLAGANSSIAELEARLQEFHANIEKITEENRRLAASESELKENLAGANRTLEAVQTELKGKSGRNLQLEIGNKALRDENRTAAEKVAGLKQWTTELEEINRRREVYLANILRRYKDVTDQYRALSGTLENRREGPTSAGAELSRIQNAISMAEEDFRQLSSLNAQALRIQRKIAGR